jgi:4-amino-4-deoxy-L-arabinose transferase-like glycosyltransferase
MENNFDITTPKEQIRRSLLWMILAGLAIRLLTSLFSYKYLLDPAEDYFGYGWEVGRVGRALASGHGFANPYQGDSGPTAVLPPLYPLIVGAVFKLFGIYSKASALILLATQSITSAITCIPIYFIAQRTFGSRIARISGWSWAFFPYAIAISAGTIWSTSLSALMFALLLWLVLHLEEGNASWWAWIDLGLLGGLIGLNNPTILPLLCALVIWIWWRLRQRDHNCIPQAAVAALIAMLCIAPWAVRNYNTFDRFIPMRSNLGLHLRVGNTLDTGEYWHADLDPPHSPREMSEMLQMGEIAYMDYKKEQAFSFIREHPGVYGYLVLKRFADFWTGVWNLSPQFIKDNPGQAANIPFCTAITIFAFIGLRRAFWIDRNTAWAFAICLLVYPIIYYLTTYEIPYRHPLDPLLVILAVVGIVRVPKL